MAPGLSGWDSTNQGPLTNQVASAMSSSDTSCGTDCVAGGGLSRIRKSSCRFALFASVTFVVFGT